MKNVGVILVVLGALALIIPSFAQCESNTTLAIGGVLMVAGAVYHMIFYKRGIDADCKK